MASTPGFLSGSRSPHTTPKTDRLEGRGCLLARTHRNRERERRALPELALHPDPPAVQLHKLPAQGEPQARALHLFGRRPHLAKLLEDLLLVLRGDADAGVTDRDLHEATFWQGADFYPTPFGRELDGIR